MGGRTMPKICPHGKVLSWGDFGPDPTDDSVGAQSCPICDGKPPPALADLVTAWPSEALDVLLKTGALEQVAWRYEARRAGPGRRVYGYLTHYAGEAGHADHEPVYRLVTEESP